MKLSPQKREEISSATIAQTLVCMLGCCGLFAATVFAADPGWWSNPGSGSQPAVMLPQVVTNDGVVSTNYITNAYAVVVQGQLKQFTARAVDYLNSNITGGAGTNLNAMVSNWAQDYATNGYNATNIKPSDYTAMNVGQLKYVASLIWTNLVTVGYTNAAPAWIEVNTNSDTAVANLGQLKEIFNFDLTDTDGDGLYDWWQVLYFGSLGNNPASSLDGNGYTLLQDYQSGANPTNYYSQPNGMGGATTIVPTLTIVSGNNQVSTAGNYTDSPLLIKITNSSGGAVLVNAPVTFSVISGGGQMISGLSGSALGSTSSLTTDANGQAQVYFQQPATDGATSTVAAASGGQTVTFTETTSTGDGSFDAPSNLVAQSVSETEMDLSWVNNATTATSIIIRQSTDNGNTWSIIATLSDPTATTYAATNLTPGVGYDFGVSGSK